MKKLLVSLLMLALIISTLSGCTDTNSDDSQNGYDSTTQESGKRLPLTLTIAQTMPSCVAFEYKDEKPYCFYAYDSSGTLYRVVWSDFTDLHENDIVTVDFEGEISYWEYSDYPDGGWTPQCEIKAVSVGKNRASCISQLDGKYILTLPDCGEKITIDERYALYIPLITDELVARAERKITKDVEGYDNRSGFYLQKEDGYLCLFVEVIKKITPTTSENDTGDVVDGGCGIDHEHLFFSERIMLSFPKTDENGDDTSVSFDDKESKYLSSYLDELNFRSGLSQGDFIAQVEKYSYNGANVVGAMGMHYDGPYGGGWQATNDLFGFYNDYKASEDGKSAEYSNRLYTKVPIDGLDTPYGVKFGDPLEKVFKTFAVQTDPYEGFSPDKNSETDMTLYGNGRDSIVFQNLKANENEYPYSLIYTETYQVKNGDGKNTTVKRCIKLSFSYDDAAQNNVLSRLEISVTEIREL